MQSKATALKPNAFINKTAAPTDADVAEALGPAKSLWDQLLSDLAQECHLVDREWNSYSPKAGWALRLKQKKRNIVYLAPCRGSFRVSFVLGDKAVRAAHEGGLPKEILTVLDRAKRYAEGTPLRIDVKGEQDVATICRLTAIKLAH